MISKGKWTSLSGCKIEFTRVTEHGLMGNIFIPGYNSNNEFIGILSDKNKFGFVQNIQNYVMENHVLGCSGSFNPDYNVAKIELTCFLWNLITKRGKNMNIEFYKE